MLHQAVCERCRCSLRALSPPPPPGTTVLTDNTDNVKGRFTSLQWLFICNPLTPDHILTSRCISQTASNCSGHGDARRKTAPTLPSCLCTHSVCHATTLCGTHRGGGGGIMGFKDVERTGDRRERESAGLEAAHVNEVCYEPGRQKRDFLQPASLLHNPKLLRRHLRDRKSACDHPRCSYKYINEHRFRNMHCVHTLT